MSELQPRDVQVWVLGIAVIALCFNAVIVLGFTHHRARVYNSYVIVSMSLVLLRILDFLTTNILVGWPATIIYTNMAFAAIWGMVLMLRLMFRNEARPPA